MNCLLLSSLLIAATFAQTFEPIVGLYSYTDGTFRLAQWNTTSPQNAIAGAQITGIGAGQTLRSIDFRPSTGQLYALATGNVAEGQVSVYLYTIEVLTGRATSTAMSSNGITISASNGNVHIDFNPFADAIRVTTENNFNYRINPTSGALTTDLPLAYNQTSTSTTPLVVSIAYSNNTNPRPSSTTLYAFEFARNNFVTIGGVAGIPSPNNGSIFQVGAEGVLASLTNQPIGFDISGNTGIAYATTSTGAFYTVDLSSGVLASLGTVRTESPSLPQATIVDMAVPFNNSVMATSSSMTSAAAGVTSAASGVVGVTSAASGVVGVTSAASGVVGVTSGAEASAGVTSAASGVVGVTSGAEASSQVTSGAGVTSGMMMTGTTSGNSTNTTGNLTTGRVATTTTTTGANNASGLIVAISTLLIALLI